MDPAFFVYYDECDFAKRLADGRLAQPLRPRRRGGPPRPALHRPRPPACRGSSNSTATATSTCASTTGGRRRWRCASSPPGPTRARAAAATRHAAASRRESTGRTPARRSFRGAEPASPTQSAVEVVLSAPMSERATTAARQRRESSSRSSASYASGTWPSTAAGAERRARSWMASCPGWRRRRASDALRREEAGAQAGPADRRARAACGRTRPGEAVGREEQLAEADQGRRDRDDPAQAGPFVGDREEALGEAVHQRQHDQVGGDEGDAGADDAERRDQERG